MTGDRYLIYKNQEWKISNSDRLNNGMVRIVSYNKLDLKNGFFTTKSDEYLNKSGFYCVKDVPKREIMEAYEKRIYAKYRGIEFDIYGGKRETQIRIVKLCCGGIEDDEIEKKLQSWGFSVFQADKFSIAYDSYISIDDPELKIIEKRTELDISKL